MQEKPKHGALWTIFFSMISIAWVFPIFLVLRRIGWEGVGQAKAVLFFILVAIVALIQNKITTSKEVDA